MAETSESCVNNARLCALRGLAPGVGLSCFARFPARFFVSCSIRRRINEGCVGRLP
eukprot:COSAG03_NODE_7946_length_853_cov_1.436340_1_plen_55_part_10